MRKTEIPKERPLYGMVARAAERKRPQIALAGCLLLAGVLTAAVACFAYVCYKKIEARDRALEQKSEERFGGIESRANQDFNRLVETLQKLDVGGLDKKLRKLEKAEFGEEWKPPIVRCPEGEECK
ncbi:hypothetical protein JW721_00285 [Candidatus Micrarchaeota archaeon]|nr:hypothetical protein [Candidatus Micrarchaeota archaeon]